MIPPPPLDVPWTPARGPSDDQDVRAFPPDANGAAIAETAAWRRADIGAANGHGNARALARALSPISLGGKANGVQLLRPDTIDLIFEEQSNGIDMVLMIPLRFGIGFGLPCPESVPAIPDGKICFWGGWGGSMVVMDPRPPRHDHLRDEQDGPGHDRHSAHHPLRRLIYEADSADARA